MLGILSPLEVDVPNGRSLFDGHGLLGLICDIPPVLREKIQFQARPKYPM